MSLPTNISPTLNVQNQLYKMFLFIKLLLETTSLVVWFPILVINQNQWVCKTYLKQELNKIHSESQHKNTKLQMPET